MKSFNPCLFLIVCNPHRIRIRILRINKERIICLSSFHFTCSITSDYCSTCPAITILFHVSDLKWCIPIHDQSSLLACPWSRYTTLPRFLIRAVWLRSNVTWLIIIFLTIIDPIILSYLFRAASIYLDEFSDSNSMITDILKLLITKQ